VAGTTKWVKGNDETFASLEAEHWDFKAQDDVHLSLLAAAATRGQTELVRRLLAAGVSANNKYGCEALAEAAYKRPNPELVDVLLAAEAPLAWNEPNTDQHWDRLQSCDALANAAAGGNAQVVRSILAHHPDVNRRDSNGRTALMQAAEGGFGGNEPVRDYRTVTQILIDAGADVNLRNENGESALMMVRSDAGIVRTLLKAGATDINAKNNRGETILMENYDASTAQALLEGGADPWLTNNDGKNALEAVSATYGSDNAAAKVLKDWMAAHPKRP
jgi:ankyrin repeat protein